MWLLGGVGIAVVIGVLTVMYPPAGVVVGAGLILGALLWIIDLLTEIRDRLPRPPHKPNPDELARHRRGLPRRLAPARKYRLQKGE